MRSHTLKCLAELIKVNWKSSLNDYQYLWESDLDEYALVAMKSDDSETDEYLIIHKETSTALIIENESIGEQVIERMLGAGVEVIEFEELPKRPSPLSH